MGISKIETNGKRLESQRHLHPKGNYREVEGIGGIRYYESRARQEGPRMKTALKFKLDRIPAQIGQGCKEKMYTRTARDVREVFETEAGSVADGDFAQPWHDIQEHHHK